MAPRDRVTLQQIAEAVGLSKYAVSRSLAGKSGVSEETRERIKETAAQLGYTKPVGQIDQRDIGLIFHDLDAINGELHMQLQNGVQREAHRLDQPIRIRWTHTPHHVAELARTTAGLLLVGPHERQSIEAASAAGIPIVRLGWVEALEQADQVTGTDHEAGQAVARYLIELGHRTIAYVCGTPGYRGRLERLYGAREVTELFDDVCLHVMQFEEHGGFVNAFQALKRQAIHPTAFFCAHDGLALTVVSELLGLGHRIPDEISVVGFGDFSPATQISPQLTTVRVEGQEIGAAGLRLLLERIRTPRLPDGPARRILIASRIVERRSAGPRKSP
jgi:LacI family transcriptional regulator